jgi:pimeloyl-ACP methyl ester carboxylesterase
MKTNAGIFQRIIASSVILFLLTLQSFAQTDQNNKTKVDSGYAPVNGLKMYYEVYGGGEPLVLIHGGVGAIEMFNPILPALSQNHKVIAVDLQAHGRTADIDRPLKFDLMADDIAALLKYLKIDKADIMGYSLGGEVALRTAIQHSQVVNKLVVVSATFKRDGWYPESLAGMSQMGPAVVEPMKQTPMYQIYTQLAPTPQDWPVLLTKLGDLLKQDYDWSEDVKKMKIPTLIIVGDADAVRTAHAVEFFGLLGGGQRDGGWDGSGRPKNCELAILPGLTHYTIFNAPALASTAIPFLDSKN